MSGLLPEHDRVGGGRRDTQAGKLVGEVVGVVDDHEDPGLLGLGEQGALAFHPVRGDHDVRLQRDHLVDDLDHLGGGIGRLGHPDLLVGPAEEPCGVDAARRRRTGSSRQWPRWPISPGGACPRRGTLWKPTGELALAAPVPTRPPASKPPRPAAPPASTLRREIPSLVPTSSFGVPLSCWCVRVIRVPPVVVLLWIGHAPRAGKSQSPMPAAGARGSPPDRRSSWVMGSVWHARHPAGGRLCLLLADVPAKRGTSGSSRREKGACLWSMSAPAGHIREFRGSSGLVAQ